MALRGLFGKFLNKEHKETENYLALILSPNKVLATIWTFDDNQIKTLGFGHKSFENLDVILHQAAIAIDAAGEQAKVDVSKVVYGLAESFLEDGVLSKTTTKLLKKISNDLELNPQAFIPISAGINHLLKVEESVTPRAVLVGVLGDFCEVHLLEGGKVSKSKSSQAPVNIEKIRNMIKGLKEEDKELPAKIVVYGLPEGSELAEKIDKADFKDVFVSVPKIDFIDDTELSRSVAYAQAADLLGYEPELKDAKGLDEGEAVGTDAAGPAESPERSRRDEGRIVKVTRKGYKLNDKVIRPAQVVVERKSHQAAGSDEGGVIENV